MPANDGSIGYDLRTLVIPNMRIGETLVLTWVPLWQPSTVTISYSEVGFTRSGSGNSRTYVANASGVARITGDSNEVAHTALCQITAGGGQAEADRLDLSGLSQGIRLGPGQVYTTVDLRNFEWGAADATEHTALDFSIETVIGADITTAITSKKLVVTATAKSGKKTIRITAKNGTNVVGQPVDVQIGVADIRGYVAPNPTPPGSTVTPLETTFTDPAALLSNVTPSTLQTGYTDNNWTVTNRMSGQLAPVDIDEGTSIVCKVVRKDLNGFDVKRINKKGKRLYSHIEGEDTRGLIVNFGIPISPVGSG